MESTIAPPVSDLMPANADKPLEDGDQSADGNHYWDAELSQWIAYADDPEPEGQGDDDEVTNETKVVDATGTGQLSLAIGGPKPTQSILTINSKQLEWGTTKQVKNGEVLSARVRLEVKAVEVRTKKKGLTVRKQVAVITSIDFDE